jgi:hypothetical protein
MLYTDKINAGKAAFVTNKKAAIQNLNIYAAVYFILKSKC